jgi:NADPH-dependent curcumin reductase CurA
MFMLIGKLLSKRIKMQGFIIFDDYADHFDEFSKEMQKWLKEDRISYREHMTQGIENTLDAFNDMLSGKNFGKSMVKLNSPL